MNAVVALRGSVCSSTPERTIEPWLRSRPMSVHIAPTSLVGCGLAKLAHSPCRSEPARDARKSAAFIQAARVIVDVHREQARSYRRRCDPIHRRQFTS